MSEFVIGQRWVVDSEPELGLGIVVDIDPRSVTLFFSHGESERRYASQQAPLTRIRFDVGDEIQLNDGRKFTVKHIIDQHGLLLYDVGASKPIVETSLAAEIRLNQPLMRMLMGQLDQPRWFSLRRDLDQAMARRWQSGMTGLLGVRANLIPHQLYIAWAACQREKVRVLLADEVGLGKTVEAGMILNRLMKLERVQRALIIVPDALQVQWLVELVRKFSISPDLYANEEHDFHAGQVHILPHSALGKETQRILEGEFELTIVDEAHHLEPESEEFRCLQHLSLQCKHLVLLTATPEQLGVEKHFARLQLLDPAKFSSLEKFLAEEARYAELNELIEGFPKSKTELLQRFSLQVAVQDVDESTVIDQALDLHGIGRVMFRNARAAVSGFPARVVQPHVLHDEEPFEWLANFLKADVNRKVLVLCHEIETVRACENYLWSKHGLDAALFHEEQDLIERDRAAAYFADMEKGAQVLVCSEIGSEGRNFQFCHHLVCMDLPDNPDLLEQRIGRLDRIGQQHDVQIHIPFIAASETQQLFAWYHEVLDCIGRQNPAAGKIHARYWSDYRGDPDIARAAKQELQNLEKEIESGRDALLERNSCRQPTANNLVAAIDALDNVSPLDLVEAASDLLQFHFEQLYEGIYSLIPSDKMLVPALPGIPPEGAEVTFSRGLACQREDLLYLTWDSPFILGLWELLQHSELGCASVATLVSRQLPAGHCLLECCFTVIVQHKYATACLGFLPQQSVRVLLLDVGDKNLAQVMKEDALQKSLQPVPKKLAVQIVRARKEQIGTWFHKADELALAENRELLAAALTNVDAHFSGEIARLERLAELSKETADENELEMLREKHRGIHDALTQHTHLQLSALRLIVITPPGS